MLTYDIFMKHSEKVVTNKRASILESRPVLTGIHHRSNGSLVATDSHRLYIGEGLHDKEDTVLSLKGKKVAGDYPDVHRLLPTNDPMCSITYATNELLQAADAFYTFGKMSESGQGIMRFRPDKGISFSSMDVGHMKWDLPTVPDPMALDAEYVLDAMKLIKACGYEEVTLNYYAKHRPVLLEAPDDVLAALKIIILPIREY